MGFFAYAEPSEFSYPRMRLHTEDAATLTHWPLQGDRDDSVGSNDWVVGPTFVKYQRVNGLDSTSDLLTFSTRDASFWSAPSNTPDIKNLPAITVACWVSLPADPPGNIPFIGIRGPGSGSSYNFPWEIGYDSGVGVRFFWQSGSKAYEGTIGVPFPDGFGKWYHVIGTRSLDGTIARLYINGLLAEEATGQSPWTGGTAQNTVHFFHNDFGTNMAGQMFSAIIKNNYTDSAMAVALYNDAIEQVTG